MTIWSWSTTAGSNATVDAAINWAEGQNANTVNNSARAMMARLAELLDDLGGTVTVSGTNTLTCTTITAFTSLANGLIFAFRGANDNTGAVTLAPNSLASKKLLKITGNGEEDLAAGDIQAGGIYIVAYSTAADGGTGAWVMINVAPPALTTYAKTLLDDADAATARTTLGLAIGTNVQAYRAELAKIYAAGSNIASSSSIDIGAASGDFVGITGTTAITALGTADAGIERTLVFGGALTLTHNGTSLILPAGGSNITTAAGDIATFRSLGSGNWRCTQYTKASGASVGSLGTMSEQNANAVTISGGTISGITDLAVADGGTGASSAADARTNLGLAIGSNVQAYSANLDTLAAVSVTAAGTALLDDADAAAQRTTLGLGTIATQAASAVTITGGSVTGITDITVADGGTGASTAANARTNLGLVIGTDVQAYDGDLAAIAALTSAADRLPYYTGAGTAALATFTTFGRSLVDDADAATARSTLGLAIGTNVQAWDADLDAIAALAKTDGNFIVGNGSTWVAESGATARTSLGLGSIATQDASNVTITGGTISVTTVDTTGNMTVSAGQINVTRSAGVPGAFNRTTDDGGVIAILQDGATEGTISVSGVTVTYGTFTGMHWSQLVGDSKEDIPLGTVVESVDDLASWGDGKPNRHLPRFKVSDAPASPAVYGVFNRWDEDGDAEVVSLGVFLIRMRAGEKPQRGDLLTSAGDGTAIVQSDEVIRSSTIAKVTSGKVDTVYDDGSFLVPCAMLCG